MENVSPRAHNRHLLVLGASGKLGRLLRRAWGETPVPGWQVHWQYRKNPADGGIVWNPGAASHADLPRADAILALWGVTPGPGRDLAENSQLALAAMQLGRELGASRVLHCSSAAVYAPGFAAKRESDAGGAINPYGAAKLEMETAIANWQAAHPGGPRGVALRLANVVGADSLFAAIGGGGADVTVTLDQFASGEGPVRSYLTLSALADAVAGLLELPDAELPPVVNLALPQPVPMAALAAAAGCTVKSRPAPDDAAAMVWLDTGRFAALLPCRASGVANDAAAIIADWRRYGGNP